MPNVKMPDHIDVPVSKINETRRVRLDNADVIAWFLAYGLKQKFADVHASIKRENYSGPNGESDWKNAVRVAVDGLVADCNAGRTPTRGARDPFAKYSPAERAAALAAIEAVRAKAA